MPILHVSEMGFERRVTLADGRTGIGRDESNPVFLKHHEVSKKHAEVVREGDRWKLVDLNSRNGTFVNGARTRECVLRDGDVVKIGHAAIVFLEGASSARLGKRPPSGKRLGEMCAERGIVREEELRKALEIQQRTRQKLGEVLIENGLADPQAVMETLGEQLAVPWIDLTRYELDAKAVALFPRERARLWCAIPVIHFEETRRLVVAMAEVENLQAIEEMEFLTYCNIEPMLARRDDVLAAIDRHYGAGDDAHAALARQAREQSTLVRPAPVEEPDEKGVARLVSQMVEEAVKALASDIHVEPRRDKIQVRFRIDGILHERKVLPKELQGALVNRIKILGTMDITEKRIPQDGHWRVTVQGREIDLRVATFPTTQGEKVVLRIHNRALAKADIESLGMPPDTREAFLRIITRPEGLLVVTGPTGSGKTTTLYAALNHVKSGQRNLVTLEDPVELDLDGVNQGQVYDHPDFTFANGLRAILRQDPNIILVGEVRDAETAQIAIQAALTGHLVLTTLHTNSAAGAIARLIDMGIEPYLITAALLGVQSQRLVRRICPDCRTACAPPADLVRACFEDRDTAGMTFWHGKGCAACPDGYRGRTGVFEQLTCTEGLRRLIVAKAATTELRAKAREEGMVTLREDALRRAVEGVTTLDEVVRVTYAEF